MYGQQYFGKSCMAVCLAIGFSITNWHPFSTLGNSRNIHSVLGVQYSLDLSLT